MAVMRCEEMLAFLNEYVDGTLAPGLCADFEKHLIGCNPCQVVVDNIRKTIVLYKEGQRVELPLEFRQKLYGALRDKWNKNFPEGSKEDK